ncbi:hypothetical protein ACFE04_030476 [Oxalis oulophora]
MCAFSSLFPNVVWPLEDPMSHYHQYQPINLHNLFVLPSQKHPQEVQLDNHSPSFSAGNSCDLNMVKKLSHNAKERHRRKKINCLYTSLRSLLPPEDQSRKMSIPNTVSRILKYIPDLQEEVERLIQKKEDLLSKISNRNQYCINVQEKKPSSNIFLGSSTISASKLSENEVLVQISTFKKIVIQTPLSKILQNLEEEEEEEGLFLINGSSFESSGEERIFHNLHLQTEKSYKLDCEVLRQKLLSLYEKRQCFSPY